MQELKSLVESGVIDQKLFKEIAEDNQISNEEFHEVLNQLDIQQLFSKLEEIENAEDIDAVIPKELRITKKEYQQALQNPAKRAEVLQKLDQSLQNIHHQVNGGFALHGNMFSTYTYLLSQKLLPLQETIIDLKQPLSSAA
jgi:SpoVK/Ycf46/Vps4 family AAA+-type ATPase